MNFVKQSRRLCGRIVVFLEQSEHGFKGPRCCRCPRSRDDCTDGRQDPCRRCQTGNDGPAAGARRERTSLPPAPGALPPAPGAAWSVCRRRQARRGRSAAGARRPAARAVSRVRRCCCCLPSSIPGAHGLKDRVTKTQAKMHGTETGPVSSYDGTERSFSWARWSRQRHCFLRKISTEAPIETKRKPS